MKSKRYFIDTDNSGHAYVVEEDHRDEWREWVNLDEEEEESWEPPRFARRINGSSARVTFSAPDFEECE